MFAEISTALLSFHTHHPYVSGALGTFIIYIFGQGVAILIRRRQHPLFYSLVNILAMYGLLFYWLHGLLSQFSLWAVIPLCILLFWSVIDLNIPPNLHRYSRFGKGTFKAFTSIFRPLDNLR